MAKVRHGSSTPGGLFSALAGGTDAAAQQHNMCGSKIMGKKKIMGFFMHFVQNEEEYAE